MEIEVKIPQGRLLKSFYSKSQIDGQVQDEKIKQT